MRVPHLIQAELSLQTTGPSHLHTHARAHTRSPHELTNLETCDWCQWKSFSCEHMIPLYLANQICYVIPNLPPWSL